MCATQVDDEWTSRSHPIKEDMIFQRRDWIFERCGWALLALIIILALAGIFSVGPLADTRVIDSRKLVEVEYQRFHRNGALADMMLHLRSSESDAVRLHLNSEFMEAFMIEDIWPQPLTSVGDPGGVGFVFAAPAGQRFPVYIALRPSKVGRVSAAARVNDEEPVSFSLFVYP